MPSVSLNPNARPRPARRRGLTLIELLIVMTILVLLVSAAIPVMTPSTEERRIREASRGLNAYLSGAAARAVQTGRPFGVRLNKLSLTTGDDADRGACIEVVYVQQPPPYAGFDDASRVIIGTEQTNGAANPSMVRVRFVRLGNETLSAQDALPLGLDPDLMPPGLFQRGDRIEVGGNLYEFSDTTDDVDRLGYYESDAGTPDGTLFAIPVETTNALNHVYDSDGDRLTDPQPAATAGFPIPYWTEPFRYKIYRQPAPTSTPPYQLPEGTAIDLRASGFGSVFFHKTDPAEEASDKDFVNETSNDQPVQIMFSPEGTISRVSFFREPTGGGADSAANEVDVRLSTPISSDVFLLIGKRENVPAVDPAIDSEVDFTQSSLSNTELETGKAKINWLSGESRWVTIGAKTGSIITSPNAFVSPVNVYNEDTTRELHERRDIEIRRAAELATTKETDAAR